MWVVYSRFSSADHREDHGRGEGDQRCQGAFFRRQVLQGFLHPVRFNRHLGQRQLQRQDHRLRLLHHWQDRLQRRRLPERVRCRPGTFEKVLVLVYLRLTLSLSGRRCRPSMRHVLETHDRDRQLGQDALQRRPQHRRAGHQPVPGVGQPAVRSERSWWHQPVRRRKYTVEDLSRALS